MLVENVREEHKLRIKDAEMLLCSAYFENEHFFDFREFDTMIFMMIMNFT